MIKSIINKAALAVIISCSGLLLSCGHRTHAAPEVHTVDPAVSPLLSRLQGSWISYEYTQSLRVTCSPFRSAEYIDALFSFMIDSNKMHHDTLYFNAMNRGQEEENFWIVFSKKDSTGCYQVGQTRPIDYEADARTSPGDKISRVRIDSSYVTIYTVASDSLRFILFDRVYRGRPADHMLKYYTTKVLFDGAYATVDSAMIFGSSHISFDPQHMGRLTGSPVYDSFDINVDLLAQHDSSDYMEFFDTKGSAESHSFIYKIKGNSIKIYPLGSEQPCRLLRDTMMTSEN